MCDKSEDSSVFETIYNSSPVIISVIDTLYACVHLWPVAAGGRRPRGPNNLASGPASFGTVRTVPDGTAPSICLPRFRYVCTIALSLSRTTGCMHPVLLNCQQHDTIYGACYC